MINAVNSFQNQSLGQYAAAGSLATESLGAIRTVTALNAQPEIISRYRVFIIKAMKVSTPLQRLETTSYHHMFSLCLSFCLCTGRYRERVQNWSWQRHGVRRLLLDLCVGVLVRCNTGGELHQTR